LSDASLCAANRKPFDALAEGLDTNNGWRDCTDFEPDASPVASFLNAFCGSPQPYLLTAARLGREPLAEAAHSHSG